jgi:hypothetical protein
MQSRLPTAAMILPEAMQALLEQAKPGRLEPTAMGNLSVGFSCPVRTDQFGRATYRTIRRSIGGAKGR